MELKSEISKVLDRLTLLHPENICLGLERTFECLNDLGNPQNNLPPTIHVAGTNGKGSTIAFIESALKECGYSISRYTSPEIVKFNERIILNNNEISDEKLLELLLIIEKLNNNKPITFFEITTCAALYAYANNQSKDDFLLLETGMGGRLDSTNVVKNTLISIITSIGLDHETFIGNTVEKIALEKAMIQKEGGISIFAKQISQNVYDVLENVSSDIGVEKSFCYGVDFFVKNYDKKIIVCNGVEYNVRHIGLRGNHQLENLCSALCCMINLKSKGYNICMDKVIIGFEKAHIAGRFEKIDLYEKFGIKNDCYVDGGHNPSAGETIYDNLNKLGVGDKSVHLVCGFLEGKDANGFISKFNTFLKSVSCLDVEHSKYSTAKGELKENLVKNINVQCDIKSYESVKHTLSKIEKNDGDIILFAGSFHLLQKLFK